MESPTKARTIGKFLGKGYHVASSMGHVRDLPQKTLGVDTEWAAVFPEGISCATQGAETWEPADCQSLDPLVFQ